ncbi:MAG: hypothetical protein QNJ30_09170 [Kiloniellales bacterium]|nr:hypothetical protein [Kiloniellales bacterium]
MSYAKPQSFQPAGRAPEGTRIRLYLGLSAILALAAWGLVSDPKLPDAPELAADRGTAAPGAGAGQEPVFDGRGKWGGYAR